MSEAPPQTDPIASSETGDSLIGRTIAGKFAIEKLLGTGAMGAVYRARQIALDKTVAVKVLHRELAADKTFTERFHREAKAASRLDHTHSIRILDFGQEPDGLLYISMDYLDGRDLLEVINHDWPLSTERIVDILSQTLSALAVAHDLGILHRDLKPENIMVLSNRSGESSSVDLVKVCDFGIAKIIDNDSSGGAAPPTVGVVIGTPSYMSPEQAKGELIDARSDLYALGVVLYHLLTQSLPFEGPSSLSILYKHVNDEPIPPSFVISKIDMRLEAICLKAMAKRKEQRYGSAREMRAALRSLVDTDSQRNSGPAAPLAAGTDPTATSLIAQNQATDSSLLPVLDAAGQGPGRRRSKLWIAVPILALAVGGFWASRHRSIFQTPFTTLVGPVVPAPATRFDIPPPAGDHVESRAQGRPRAAAAAAPEPAPPRTATSSGHRQRRSKSSAPDEGERGPQVSPVLPEPPPSPVAQPPVLAPTPPIAAAPAPPVDPKAAHVEVGSATGASGTTATSVNKAMAPLADRMTACYRSALAPNSGTTDSSGTLHIETNEDGVINDARLSARVSPATAQCIVQAVKGRKVANVDTGSASADVPLAFKIK